MEGGRKVEKAGSRKEALLAPTLHCMHTSASSSLMSSEKALKKRLFFGLGPKKRKKEVNPSDKFNQKWLNRHFWSIKISVAN